MGKLSIVSAAKVCLKLSRVCASMCSSCGIGVKLVASSCELPKYLCTFWSCKFQKKSHQWTSHQQLVTAAPAFAFGIQLVHGFFLIFFWLVHGYIECYVSLKTIHSISWPACKREAGPCECSLLKDAKQCVHVPGNVDVNRRLAKLEMSVLSVRA